MRALGLSEEVKFEIDLSQLIIDVPVRMLAKAWGQGQTRVSLLFAKRAEFLLYFSQRIEGVLFSGS